MTDRDTFAAAALTGLIACMKDETGEDVCKSAFGWADSMLRERGVTEPLPKEKRAEVSVTLTDHERACVLWASAAYERRYQERVGLENNGPDQCGEIAATLRKLLERMK